MPDIGGGIMNSIPKFTGPSAPLQDAPASPMPEGTGLGIPSF